MLFTFQHLAWLALAGLNALAVAQIPDDQTQIAHPLVGGDDSCATSPQGSHWADRSGVGRRIDFYWYCYYTFTIRVD